MFSNDQFIPLCVPNLGGNEMKYVTEAIQDSWVSSVGPHVTKFEEEFATYVGTQYAVACSNGTAALHISLIVSGVNAGEEVLVPNLTFIAPVNAVRYVGAHPVFMDSDWATFGMDVQKLYDFIHKETVFRNNHTYNKSSGRLIRAIIPMHALGYPVDIDPLLALCNERNIVVIEDATESLGSTYKGKRTGNFSKMACFSFNGNKIMTTGGGGMICTNQPKLAELAKHLTTQAKKDPVEYDHDYIGYNYRLVNVLAAIGLAQLEQIDDFVAAKRRNLALYKSLIDSIPGMHIHTEAAHSKSNYWMYSLILEPGFPYSVREMVAKFAAVNIQTRPIWRLMNSLPMFKEHQAYHCDLSQKIYENVVSIPCSTHITENEIKCVANFLKQLS